MNRLNRILVVLTAGLLALSAQAQDPNAQLFKFKGEYLRPQLEGSLRVEWLPDGAGFLESELAGDGGGFLLYAVDPVTQKRTPVFGQATQDALVSAFNADSGQSLQGLPFERFTRELDGNAILFSHETAQYLFDLKLRQLRQLVLPEVPAPDAFLFYLNPQPVFSPDFELYAYVKNSEIFVADTRTGKERQLTTGGNERTQYGQLGLANGLVWSPDSSQIAFLLSDCSDITAYPIISEMSQQPDISWLGYSFASDAFLPCSVNVVDVANGARSTVATCTEAMPYIRDIRWRSDGSELLLTLQSQWFDQQVLKAFSPQTQKMRTVLVDEAKPFMNPNRNFHILSDNRRFTWSSERSGFEQVYLYDLDGKLIRQLTDVPWETRNIEAIDEAGEWVYFQGAPQNGTEVHLYRVKFDGSGFTDLTPERGYHQVSMDPAGAYFTDMHSSLTEAPAATLNKADGSLIRQIGSFNVDAIKAARIPDAELITLKTADGQADMYGMMYKPAGFDPGLRYPLLVYVYGGPHSKSAFNAYQSLSVNAQMAQFGFVVVEVDARGTRGRGLAYQGGNYLGWGQNDIDDQAAAVKQLAERSYIDTSRVGIHGISHGGYMTLLAMLRYPDVFHVGVSGAPIAVLQNGPIQYVGRPMRSPQANPEGYAKGNVLNYVGNLKGKLLLYHGTADRNALMVNSKLVADALIKAGKPFDFMVYPEGEHVMQGQRYKHVMTKQLAYFLEYLKPEGWEESLQQIWADLPD